MKKDGKKSIIFLINGLGIERPGSYSISLDQDMPNLARTKETSYFTTAFTNSLEPRSAYQQFFIGDTYNLETKYISESVLNPNLKNNQIYQNFVSSVAREKSKLHVFLEPTTEKIVEEINNLVNGLQLEKDKEVYLHLLLPQLTVNDYDKLISIINYIKYHINQHITVGFVIGKDYLSDELTPVEKKEMQKTLFYCSCERWTRTEEKLGTLKSSNIIPCKAPGFCATNDCFIKNGDTILFFNSRRADYDKFIRCIYENAPEVFKNEPVNIPIFSLIKLFSRFSIPNFAENVTYQNSLSNMLERYDKKALILTSRENVSIVNFYANGLDQVNNPRIVFMILDDTLMDYNTIVNLIDNTDYDLIIFDYYMDTSSTINNLKNGLHKLDKVLGNIVNCSENKHSVFITSLFGLKKEIPVADYNTEKVLIDYQMQIPIFFYDYTYPAGKYALFPGDTNLILSTAMWCITGDNHLESLVREKGFLKNLFRAF